MPSVFIVARVIITTTSIIHHPFSLHAISTSTVVVVGGSMKWSYPFSVVFDRCTRNFFKFIIR